MASAAPQPAPSGDAFDLLGLEPRFDLDPARLERAYLSRAARLHPDLASGNPDAPAKAAALNHAKATLSDPEARANLLLARLGGPAKDQDKSLPAGFLMDILETRERAEADLASADPARLAPWKSWTNDQRAAYAQRVSELFAAALAQPHPDTLRAIRLELNAWRYIERLAEQLDPARSANL
ncbi:MAG: DnaJ domain-containing protein [Planctomycetota bacterium]|nr:DnaJ domain-containing protein [Planctomycetota bacterium]